MSGEYTHIDLLKDAGFLGLLYIGSASLGVLSWISEGMDEVNNKWYLDQLPRVMKY